MTKARADIVDLLGLTEPQVIVTGFDRPNIYRTVRPVSGEAEKQRLLPSLVRVVCASNPFGMGIDRPDIEAEGSRESVIH